MIVFDLRCANEHVFEAWFQDSAAFDEQAARHEILCPVCSDTAVSKALMAPNVAGSRKKAADRGAEPFSRYVNALAELRDHVEKNCDYVGEAFPEEARKIHYGEAERRNIYGEASDDEATEMHDEGIEFQRIPWAPREDA